MNLLDLMIKVGIEDEYTKGMSTLVSNVSTQAGMIVSQLSQIQSSLNQIKDKSIKVDADTSSATSALDKLSAKSIAIANEIASAVGDALKSAVGGIKDFFTSAFQSYGEYEQQVGAIETFFKGASGTVIANAQEAYKTAGMSANEYMQNVSSVAMTLINSVKNDRASALQEDVETQQKALDQQVTNLKRALDEEYTEAQRASARAKQAYSDQLSDQLDDLRNSLNAELKERREALAEATNLFREQLQEQLEEQRKAYQEQLQQRRNELQAEYDAKNKQLSDSYSALQKSLDKEVDAFRKATNKKVKEIDREYRERLKLTDKAEYDRLAEIQKQIDALEGQSEAEKEASKKREQQQKIDELEYKSTHAKYAKDRLKAEQDLADLRADIERESRDKQRKVAIEKLKQQQDDVRDHYDKQRENLRDYYDDEKEKYKESRDGELDLLRESNKTKLSIAEEGNKLLLNNIKVASDEELTELQEKFDKELQQMSKTNSELLKERQKSDSQQIEELQEHHNQIIKEQQRANRDALTEFGYGEADKLKALKQSHENQLNELKAYVKDQKKVLKMSGDNIGEYVDATEEDLKRAAEVADIMVKDMADNHNKTGQSLQLLEFAYNGMSRGEFRMLDNLRLGFRGNKAGMQELIDQANLLKEKYGETGKFSIDSFQDIVEAIHMVQVEQGIAGVSTDELMGKMRDNDFTLQELYKLGEAWSGHNGNSIEESVAVARNQIDEWIKSEGNLEGHFMDFRELLGTTASEAEGTLQGSMNKLHGAWENWLASLTDDKWDVKQTTDELITAASETAGLLIPRLAKILDELKALIKDKAPKLWEDFKRETKDFIDKTLSDDEKKKFQDFIDFLSGLAEEVQEIVHFLSGVARVLGGIADFFGKIGEFIGSSKANAVTWLERSDANAKEYTARRELQKTLYEYGDDSVKEYINGLSGKTADLETLNELTEKVRSKMPKGSDLKASGDDAISGYKDGLKESVDNKLGPYLQNELPSEIKDLTSTLNKDLLKENGSSITDGLVDSSKEKWESKKGFYKDEIAPWIKGNKGPVEEDAVLLSDAGRAIIDGLVNSSEQTWNERKGFFEEISPTLSSFFDGSIELLNIPGLDIINGLGNGANDAWTQLSEFFGGIPDSIGSNFDGAIDWLFNPGKDVVGGLDSGAHDSWNPLSDFFGGINGEISGKFNGAIDWLNGPGGDIISGLNSGINDVWSDVSRFFENISDDISGFFLGARDWLWSAGSNIMEGLYDGISSMWDSVANFITGINDWLIMNKGPEQRDKTMLIPAGKWIMGGFKKGLENGFSKDVAPYVEDMNAFMEGSFGNMNPGDASEWAYEVSNSIVKAFEDASKSIVSSFDEAFMSIEHMATRSSNAMAEQMANMLPGVIRGTSSANGFAGGAQPPQQTVVLQLDGIEFGKMVYRYYNKEAYRIGVNVGSN